MNKRKDAPPERFNPDGAPAGTQQSGSGGERRKERSGVELSPAGGSEAGGVSSGVVYCGPDIPGVAKQYTVYRNGVPGPLAEALAESPPLRGLLVPLDQLPQARRALESGSGHIYRLFRLARAGKEA